MARRAGMLMMLVSSGIGLGTKGASGQELQLADAGPRFVSAPIAGTPTETRTDVRNAVVFRRRIAVDLRGISLDTALQEIAQRAGLHLSYSAALLPVGRPVWLATRDITVGGALTAVLYDAGVDVQLAADGRSAAIVPRTALMVSAVRQRGQQSTGTVVGRIADAGTGAPVIDAAVVIDDTRYAARTRADGRYTLIGVSGGTYAVTVHRLGYIPATKTATVRGADTAVVDFALTPATATLEQVVTTVTGDQRRAEVGNAIATIAADSVVATAPVTTLDQLLNARASSVQILPANGLAGESARIRIRGINSFSTSSDPLLIVDGVRVENAPGTRSGTSFGFFGQLSGRIDDIPVDEIESIEIVKGPSAATLYGTDAANGVIVIGTKRGRAGHTVWSGYGEGGLSAYPKKRFPDHYYAWGHSPATGAIMQCPLVLLAANSCVQDSLTRFNPMTDAATSPLATGYRQQYGLQAVGGVAQFTYFLAGDYQSEVGPLRMPNADQQRISAQRGGASIPSDQIRPNALDKTALRGNVRADLGPRADVSLSSGLLLSTTRLPTDNIWFSDIFGVGYRDSQNGWSGQPGELFAVRANQDLSRYTGGASGTWRPFAWLANRATLGIDLSSLYEDGLQRYGQGPAFFRTGVRSDGHDNTTLYSVDLGSTATFEPSAALSSKTSVGAQYNRRVDLLAVATGIGLSPGAQTIAGAQTVSDSESTVGSVVAGAYLEQTVGVWDRLFLTGALRADGGSTFGSDFHAALYPKGSISWLLSREPFFPRVPALTSLRLRAAYGASGVQPSATAALATLQAVNGLVDGQVANGLRQLALGNPRLKPERQGELEAGLDAEWFGGRLTIEGTYYDRESRDALVDRALGPSSGLATQTVNIGSVRNYGWEGSLSARALASRRLALELALNGSINTNRLVKLGSGVAALETPQLWTQVPGYPLFGFWDHPIVGYGDSNHDGIIEPNEVVTSSASEFLGSTTPRHQLTASSRLTLLGGRVAVSTMFDYRGGFVLPAYSFIYGCLFAFNCRAVNDPHTPLVDQARAVASAGFDTAPFTTDAHFVRWRELAVTLVGPERWTRLVGARSASLTVSARNLALFTHWPGVDPEGSINPGTDNSGESGDAPLARYWLLRLNLSW